jgi:hypothetical protein
MKAFHMTVLRGSSRLNMFQRDASLYAPSQKMTTGQFRPVVQAQSRAWALSDWQQSL